MSTAEEPEAYIDRATAQAKGRKRYRNSSDGNFRAGGREQKRRRTQEDIGFLVSVKYPKGKKEV